MRTGEEHIIHHKLILIDGITGSGKSSTAQYLARQLNLNAQNTIWHHEEETCHPLTYHDADIESLHSKEEVLKFMDVYPRLVEAFIEQIQEDETIHIIESFYLQNLIRILFQNNIANDEISRFFEHINRILAPVDPVILYFHHSDVHRSIRRIWKDRGERWKAWFVETDSQAPYVLQKALSGEHAALTLWNDYQAVTDTLIKNTPFPVIQIDAQMDWSFIYDELHGSLDIPHMKVHVSISSHNIAGTYRQETNAADGRTCKILINDHGACWNMFWREQRLLPLNSQEYLVHSFPLRLRFHTQGEIVQSFTIHGTPIYGMVGTKYEKISD